MSNRVRITEKMFWELWPRVKDKFPAPCPHRPMRCEDGDCPITAVARLLGCGLKDHEFPRALHHNYHKSNPNVHTYPDWAEEIAYVADGDYRDGELLSVAERLTA